VFLKLRRFLSRHWPAGVVRTWAGFPGDHSRAYCGYFGRGGEHPDRRVRHHENEHAGNHRVPFPLAGDYQVLIAHACFQKIEPQNVRVIHCEASNFTDSVSWGNPGTNMANQATFGVINSGEGGRGIQRGARAMF